MQKNRYALLVNRNRPEKNAMRGAIAFMRLFEKNYRELENFKVVMLGGAFAPHIQKMTKKFAERFVICEYVPQKDLDTLEKNAHLFLYPTLNEGFGYPPIDCMKYETLSACSAMSAVTEACGDAVLYFNPFDIEEIKIRILESFDPSIIQEKKAKMKIRYNEIRTKQKQDLDLLVKEIVGEE